ncbi:putative fibroblast growth factor 1 [Genypterus blacodes]|uniref:putative fibroblast growth factor 1 n=1 Tax=Genypterus blacodes TaxID=154954 RepID=UPI003F764420
MLCAHQLTLSAQIPLEVREILGDAHLSCVVETRVPATTTPDRCGLTNPEGAFVSRPTPSEADRTGPDRTGPLSRLTFTGMAEGASEQRPWDYRRRTRLYCMNGGHHLQILHDGTVQGHRDDGDPHTVLKLKAVDRGVVIIQGTEAERYLAMSDEGRLYSSPTVNDECYFLEKLEENHYNTYQPQKYQDRKWYVALKKNGKAKPGPRTHIGQKAIFFLPRQLEDSGE